jgi:CBS domain-containing protein
VFSQRVRYLIEPRKLLVASPDTTVAAAAKKMADKKVGAVVVLDGETMVGIFTERDAVFRVIAKGADPKTTQLSAVMTSDPRSIAPDKSFGKAMALMHEIGCRHLPVVDDGKLVGILSARNALDPDMEEFVAEEHRRKKFIEED